MPKIQSLREKQHLTQEELAENLVYPLEQSKELKPERSLRDIR